MNRAAILRRIGSSLVAVGLVVAALMVASGRTLVADGRDVGSVASLLMFAGVAAAIIGGVCVVIGRRTR